MVMSDRVSLIQELGWLLSHYLDAYCTHLALSFDASSWPDPQRVIEEDEAFARMAERTQFNNFLVTSLGVNPHRTTINNPWSFHDRGGQCYCQLRRMGGELYKKRPHGRLAMEQFEIKAGDGELMGFIGSPPSQRPKRYHVDALSPIVHGS
jgi:hypothetical protein